MKYEEFKVRAAMLGFNEYEDGYGEEYLECGMLRMQGEPGCPSTDKEWVWCTDVEGYTSLEHVDSALTWAIANLNELDDLAQEFGVED